MTLLELFRANPESVVLRESTGTERSKDGKFKAEYTTYRRAPSARDEQLHLAGKVCIVAKPDLPGGTCAWAALDFDFYQDKAQMLRAMGESTVLDLPLAWFESKSGGLHGFVFFAKPILVEAARVLLEKWKAQLGYQGNPKVEVFPKPVKDGKVPFGIALPFFGQPERFKAFVPTFHEADYWTPPNGNCGLENLDPQDYGVDLNSKEEIPNGQHYITLRRIAGRLRHDGADEAAIAAKLLEVCEQRCVERGSDWQEMCKHLAKRIALYYKPAVTAKAVLVSVPEEKISLASSLCLPDMPKAVLCGRLGEICQAYLKDFAIAYAWPALLAAASVCVSMRSETGKVAVNLYVGLVGPVGTGKSQAIERACNLLGVKAETVMAGSAEGLLAKIGDLGGAPVLSAPDELSHLLEKAQIANAAYAFILNRLFYHDRVELTVTHRKPVNFHARLSLVAGIVDEKFGDGFGSATTSGLYDRFLFAQNPTGFQFKYRPDENPAVHDPESKLLIPRINPDVWEERNRLAKEEQINFRLLDIALRTSLICGAFDGREELRAIDLAPAWELARYEKRVRALLVPNPGKNHEAQVALRILGYLETHSDGKYLKLRDVLTAVHAYDFGPAMVERVIGALTFAGDIEQGKIKNSRGREIKLIRRVEAEE